MSEQSATPESGALTVYQAVASLIAPEPVEQEAPVAQDAPEPEENTSEASPDAEAAEGAENPDEGETQEEVIEEAATPLDPPLYWKPEAKAQFAALPPELQAVVLEQEGPREAATAKAKAEAAEISQRANAEMAKITQLAEVLSEHVPKWVENFQSRWGTQTPDWVAYAHEHGVEAMTLAKVQFDSERQQLAEVEQVQLFTANQARQARVTAEFTKLAEIAPDLADPETGGAKRTEISQKLVKLGIAPESVQNISALEMTLARDAFLWREAQAKLTAAPKPKPAAPAQKAPVRPAAGQSQSPAQRTAISAQNAFNARPTQENAVALLLAKKA